MPKALVQTVLFLIFILCGIGSVILITGIYMIEPVTVWLPLIDKEFLITGERLSFILGITALTALLLLYRKK